MTSDEPESLSTIVPVYNEESNLPELVASLMPVLNGLNLPFEIIFINDGSTDDSAAMPLARKPSEHRATKQTGTNPRRPQSECSACPKRDINIGRI